MPPKGKGKKGKKKKEEFRVARAEPVDGDDREIAMMWEKIGAIGPNPFAPAAHAAMYVNASSAVPSGPVTGAVVVPAAPPGVSGWGSAALAQQGGGDAEEASSNAPNNKRGGGTNKAAGDANKDAAASGGGSPNERHASPPTTAQAAMKPTQQDQKIAGTALNARVAPLANPQLAPMGIVPPRRVGQEGRAAHTLLEAESSLLKAQALQSEAKDEERALLEAIAEETRAFVAASEELHAENDELEAVKDREHAMHQDKLTEQAQQFAQAKFEIEDALERLNEERPEVEGLLEQKKRTRTAIADAKAQLAQMAVDHVANVKNTKAEHDTQKQRLETTMTNKLRRTVEELASLTADQHAARRERAEQERERMTDELAAAEQQSRSLAARARRLTNSTDMLRRDVALEAERRAFLSTKNASLAGKLQKLVAELEGLERRFVQQSPRDVGRNDGRKAHHHLAAMQDDGGELANIVDQQYEIILQLRRDLVALRGEVSRAEEQLAATQRATMQPDDSAGGALVPYETMLQTAGGGDEESAAYNALVRRVVIETVKDMEVGFVNAGRRLEDVNGAERRALMDYLVKRINNAVLGVRGGGGGATTKTLPATAGSTALIPRPPPGRPQQHAATI